MPSVIHARSSVTACTPGRCANLSASQATLESISAAEHPQCLMCSAANPFGLKLRFTVQSDGSVLATFPCRDILQSYPETLHGGVISALLDAAMTNALFSIGVVAVTAELTVRFLAPVSLNHGAVIRASIDEATSHSLYYVRSEFEQDRRLMARASAKFLVKGAYGIPMANEHNDANRGLQEPTGPVLFYNEVVIDHFMNPRNVGELAEGDTDGFGLVGDPSCGDQMKLWIAVQAGRIAKIAFKSFGCPGAIATSSMLTALAEGRTLEDAKRITDDDVIEALGSIPEKKRHCSLLGVRALHAALDDWERRRDAKGRP